MTPKEKAEELFQKYYNNYGYYGIPVDAIKNSKQFALIAIEFAREFITGDLSESFDKTMYLFEIKQEIEKL